MDDLQEVMQFGLKYGTGFGFTMEEITIFYLHADKELTLVDMARILNQPREVIRKKLVSVLRRLRRYMQDFEK